MKRCPYLDVPVNGNKTQNGSAEGSMATFSCNAGYDWQAGASVRTCQADGTWTGSNADYICGKQGRNSLQTYHL